MSKSTEKNKQYDQLHSENAKFYLDNLLSLFFAEDEKRQELDHVTKTIETPDGGVYLLQFQHVKGPRIKRAQVFKKKED